MAALVDVTPEQAASLLTAAKQYDGKPYFTGAGARSNPTAGFDCSGLVWYSINQAGFTYSYSDTADFPHNLRVRKLRIPPDQAEAGDILLFSGHMGFFDPNPPVAGKTLYSATSHGVRYESPRFWGTQLGIYRLQVGN